MSKYKEKSEKDEKKELYTEEDYKRFCEVMNDFIGNKRIYDTLYSPFERYLHSLKVISFSEVGRYRVHDPMGHTKLSAMNARFELREYHRQEEFMQQNPEARTAFQERIAAMRKNLTEKLKTP